MILAHLNQLVFHPAALGLFQDQSVGFDPGRSLEQHGLAGAWRGARALHHVDLVAAVIIDRDSYFNAARKQSREFAPASPAL